MRWRLLGATAVIAATVTALVVGPPAPTAVAAWAGDTGWTAGLTYAAVYAVAVLLPVPKAMFSLAAGALFGVAGGVAVTVSGATLGAVLAFAAARVLGRETVQRWVGSRAGRLETLLSRRGFATVLGLRLVPLVPFTAMNYAAGLTALSWSQYVAGTVLGIFPASTLYAVLGAYGQAPGSWPFLVALTALALLSATGVAVSWWHRRQAGRAAAARRPADG